MRWAVAAGLALFGCLPEITLPTCSVDGDCDLQQGYCTCSAGYCFKEGCAAAPSIAKAPCVGTEDLACCQFESQDIDCWPTGGVRLTSTPSPPSVAAFGGAVGPVAVTAGEELVVVDPTSLRLLGKTPVPGLRPGAHGWPVATGPDEWVVLAPEPVRVGLSGAVALELPETGSLVSPLAATCEGVVMGLGSTGRLWRFPSSGAAEAFGPVFDGKLEGAQVYTLGTAQVVVVADGRFVVVDSAGEEEFSLDDVTSTVAGAQNFKPGGAALLVMGATGSLRVIRPDTWEVTELQLPEALFELLFDGENTLIGPTTGDDSEIVAVTLDSVPPKAVWRLPGGEGAAPVLVGDQAVALFRPVGGVSVYRLPEDSPSASLAAKGALGSPPVPLSDGTLFWFGNDGRPRRLRGALSGASQDWPRSAGGQGLNRWLGGRCP